MSTHFLIAPAQKKEMKISAAAVFLIVVRHFAFQANVCFALRV
jgi:hypothetical protein